MRETLNIPEGWQSVKLGDIFAFRGGGTPSKNEASYWNGDISWASVKDIKGDYLFNTQDKITEVGLTNSNTNVAHPGDVILVTRISPGKTTITKIKTAINQDLKIVIPKIEINIEFVKYIFQSIEKQIIELSSGTTVLGISINNLSEITIPLPPLAEQHRIVAKIEELFSNLDKGIERLKAAQQQLKIYRQSVLKWAFEGRLTDNRNIKWKTLGELCDDVEYGSAAKSKEEGEIPVIRMGNLQNGRIHWSDLVFTDDPEEIRKYKLHKNDVLFNRTNSPEWVGKTAIYKGERPAIFAGYLIRIRYKRDMLNPDYLNYYLNSQEAKNYGNTVKSYGVNQSNINGTKLKGYPFPFTSLPEQQRIVSEVEDRLSIYSNLEECISTSLHQVEALRQSILKKAFEGKLIPAIAERRAD